MDGSYPSRETLLMTAMLLHLLLLASAAALKMNPLSLPTPGAPPIDVVHSQLLALQQGDIERCFNFASPANQRSTGPKARFEMMVRHEPAYSPLVGCTSFEVLSALSVNDKRWRRALEPTLRPTLSEYLAIIQACRLCWRRLSQPPLRRCRVRVRPAGSSSAPGGVPAVSLDYAFTLSQQASVRTLQHPNSTKLAS